MLGKRITIYDIADILGQSYPLVITPRNCRASFRSTGIFPVNNMIFNEADYMPSTVTDVELVEAGPQRKTLLDNENEVENYNLPSVPTSNISPESKFPSDSNNTRESKQGVIMPCTFRNDTTPEKQFIPPHSINPYPAVAATFSKNRQRKKKTTEILINSPVLKRIEQGRESKRFRDLIIKSRPQAKKKITNNKETHDKNLYCDKVDDNSNGSNAENEESFSDSNDGKEEKNLTNIIVNSFVLEKFVTKRTMKYYVVRLSEIFNDFGEMHVSFFTVAWKLFYLSSR